MRIVLVEPEIHSNTGNIARTCSALGAELHLVRPLGFSMASRYLRRAGMDYWQKVTYHLHDTLMEALWRIPPETIWYLSGHGQKRYDQVAYGETPTLVFGRESRGLSASLLEAFSDRTVYLPMCEGIRSLNLANAVAITAYEAWRQQGYAGSR